MKAEHYVGIIVRLFAIFIFLKTLNGLALLFENLINGSIHGVIASSLTTAFTYLPWLIVAIVLWNFPLTVARKVIPDESSDEVVQLSPRVILTVLISAISTCLLYWAIMDGIHWITYWNIASSSEDGAYFELSADAKASVYTTAIEFFTAAVMFFNAKKIAYIGSKF